LEVAPALYQVFFDDDLEVDVTGSVGVTASDVQVRYVDDRVKVRIDRFRQFYDEFEMVYPGRGLSLEGSTRLPDHAHVDTDAASATLSDDGTLEVRIPKLAGSAGSQANDSEAPVDDTEAHEHESDDE